MCYLAWIQDYLIGHDLYNNGDRQSACDNPDQRLGWKSAQKVARALKRHKKQLETKKELDS